MQDGLKYSPLYAAPLKPLNVARHRQAAPADIFRTPDANIVPVFRMVAGVARFLASIDIVSAYIQRKALYSTTPVDLLDSWWQARIGEVLDQRLFAIPGPLDPQKTFNWQEQLQQMLQVLIAHSAASPLLWSWTVGGAGCCMIEEQSTQVTPKLTSCLFLYDGESGGNARAPSLEVLLSTYYFNNCGWDWVANKRGNEPRRRLLNLPGELLLYHGDPARPGTGMPIRQWRDLSAKQKPWSVTVGPTKTGKYGRYGLIGWLDTQHRCYEMDWKSGSPIPYRHRLDSYELTKWIDDTDLNQPAFISRWRRL